MANGQQPGGKAPGRPSAVLTAIAAVIAGFAGIYVTLGRSDNAAQLPAAATSTKEPAPAQAPPSGPGTNTLSQGHMAAFVFRKEPEALPEVKFQDADGKERTLADWRGKVVLLNLWATWCVPCRKEMPALDRLQTSLGSDRFQVVAVSVDRTGIAGARKFLEETKTASLGVYADPTVRLTSSLRAAGLPATLLIDKEGREIGRLLGPAEWDSEDAKRLIQSAME